MAALGRDFTTSHHAEKPCTDSEQPAQPDGQGLLPSREELETIARVVRDENRNRVPGDELLVIADEVYKYVCHGSTSNTSTSPRYQIWTISL